MLLNELVTNYAHERISRVERVANFLLNYVENNGRAGHKLQNTYWWDYLEMQRWVALSFVDPDSAAIQLAAALQNADKIQDGAAKVRLGGLASVLSMPLIKHQELLMYLKGIQYLEDGDQARARGLLEPLGDKTIVVGEYELPSAATLILRHERPESRQETETSQSLDEYSRFGIPIPFGGALPRSSPFYVERDADQTILNELRRGATTIVINAPRQMGKSSLLVHTASYFSETMGRAVLIDLSAFSNSTNDETFYYEFCHLISRSLGIDDKAHEHWNPALGFSFNLTNYLEDYVLPEINSPLLVLIDEAEAVLNLRSNFFSMLRAWHNDRAIKPEWRRLSIIIATGVAPYNLINDPNVSPFNVGISVSLGDFTLQQTEQLNRQLGSILSQQQMKELFTVLHGHPLLTATALSQFYSRKFTFEQLLSQATDVSGPYSMVISHLLEIAKNDHWAIGLRQILEERKCENSEVSSYLQLQGIAVTRRNTSEVDFRNQLYTQFFRQYFESPQLLEESTFEYDAFISYRSTDEQIARRLFQTLNEAGFKIWFDSNEIKPGDDWQQKLTDGFRQSKCLIAILSANSVNSRQIQSEWESGISNNLPVLPVLISDIDRSSIPTTLQSKLYLDLRGDYESSVDNLIDALEYHVRYTDEQRIALLDRKYDAYISYSMSYRSQVLRIHSDLEAAGLSVWIDTKIKPGMQWQ